MSKITTKKEKVLKKFIVRKYIMASSVSEALKLERRAKPDDVFVDDEWRKNNEDKVASEMGFSIKKKK